MRRVIVIGSPGAGKSAFAQTLARRTGLPLIHLDEEYWLPNWTRRYSAAEWLATVQEIVSRDRWIIDGNYPSTLELRARHADHAIVLATPRPICLSRVLCRAWLKRRPDNAVLQGEPLDWAFLKTVWNSNRQVRSEIARLQSLGTLPVTVLRTGRDARRFLAGVTRAE